MLERRLSFLLALPLGALAGALGTLVHRVEVGLVPAGLVLALALTAVAAAGGRSLAGGRVGVISAAVGWFVPVTVFSTPRAEGDLLIVTGMQGTVWLFGGAALLAVALMRGYAPAGPSAPPPPGR